MTGALIGAGLSALSAAGNWWHSKQANDEMKATLDADAASLRSDIVTGKYGDPKYSGANYVLNDVAEKLRERSQARRASSKVVGTTVGAQQAGDEQDAETLKEATAQTYAQGKQAGMQEAAAARQALSQNRQNMAALKANQSANITKAMTSLGAAGAQIVAADLKNGYADKTGAKGKASTGSNGNSSSGYVKLYDADSFANKVTNPDTQSIEDEIELSKQMGHYAPTTQGVGFGMKNGITVMEPEYNSKVVF